MERLLEEYNSGYDIITKAISGIPNEGLVFKPSLDTWCIKEVIIHIVDLEIIGIHRMKKVLAEENPLLTGFDQADAWANRLQYIHLDHEAYLHLFKILRESFLPILKHLSAEEIQRTGVHVNYGKMTVKELLALHSSHVTRHLPQIQRIKEAYYHTL